MKQLFFSLIITFLCFGNAHAKMVSVIGEKVNLRSGPDANSSILWEYAMGFPLKVITSKGNWYKVVDFENDVGWIFKNLVASHPHLIVKKKIINIRKGPGTKYPLIGKANYGVVFKTLKQQKGWAKISHQNGITGWVRRDLVWGW